MLLAMKLIENGACEVVKMLNQPHFEAWTNCKPIKHNSNRTESTESLAPQIERNCFSSSK